MSVSGPVDLLPRTRWRGVLARALVFSAASNAAVLFVIGFGRVLWPEGLPVNSQHVFWLPSGVNTAGLLVLGLSYAPVLLLNALPAWLVLGEPLDVSLLASATNALEAWLAAGLISRVGRFTGRFDSLRSVAALLAASLAAPLANTLVIPAFLAFRGVFPWSAYPQAIGNWNLSNGAAMVMLTPFLVTFVRRDGTSGGHRLERLLVGFGTAVLAGVGFAAMLEGGSRNLGFLAFPFVLYTAVRFGIGDTSLVLAIALAMLYGALAKHAQAQPPAAMAETLWYVQAFCWVLAATGLVVAALATESRRAEGAAAAARSRALEISLREERARLDALRYRLDPHFLFNSLNSVSAVLPIRDGEVARLMLARLSDFLRATLAQRDTPTVSLREEMRLTELYLAIERARFGEDLEVVVTADEACLDLLVPSVLLQPLVENAVVHGFAASQGRFRLEIRAARSAERLRLEVANTGRWRDPSGEGLGLSNTRRRLELLYGSGAELTVEAAGGWVCVSVDLPARSANGPDVATSFDPSLPEFRT